MCHSPPPARATVRANGGASVTTSSGVHDRDRGRRDAVDAPAREGHALRLAPPPVLGERGAPVLLRVDAARRRASGRRSVPRHAGAEQPRRPVLAEPRHHCAGPSGPNAARPFATLRRSAPSSPGPEVDAQRRRRRRAAGRRRRARPSREIRARRRSPSTPRRLGGGERHHRPVAAHARDRADAPARAREAPVVALERRRRARAGGRRTGGRRPCGGRAVSARDQGVGDGDVPAGLAAASASSSR